MLLKIVSKKYNTSLEDIKKRWKDYLGVKLGVTPLFDLTNEDVVEMLRLMTVDEIIPITQDKTNSQDDVYKVQVEVIHNLVIDFNEACLSKEDFESLPFIEQGKVLGQYAKCESESCEHITDIEIMGQLK